MADVRQELHDATAAISLAATVLGAHRDLYERFMKEARDMESFGAIIDPTLFMSSERRAVEALMKPIYRAALDFLDAHDRQIAAAREAMGKVDANG